MPNSQSSPALVCFRRDLRVSDNAAVLAACASGRPVIAAFVLDESGAEGRKLGGASRWWLHHSLTSLQSTLATLNIPLWIGRGPAEALIPDLAGAIGAAQVDWTRPLDPVGQLRDTRLKADLKSRGLSVTSHSGQTLTDPWAVKSGSGGAFKVFTPYSKAARRLIPPYRPVRLAAVVHPPVNMPSSLTVPDLNLLPTKPDWSAGLKATFCPGEQGALETLARFAQDTLRGYADRRNLPYEVTTSRLSAHLRWGEISPQRVWHNVAARALTEETLERDAFVFHQELLWRDFSHHLLWQSPTLAETNWKPAFDAMAWRSDPVALRAWQKGQTGYPIVDAGMRELWTTGWMHNRVRMIVASFLVKHLLIDWREGEAWFWDTLVDACPANNPAGWQWTAGTGADAAPYFRVFNPISQGESFDPHGIYVRQWVPELARLPNAFIHKPWETEPHVLRSCGIELGVTYPRPIVDHKAARQRALNAFAAIRQADDQDVKA